MALSCAERRVQVEYSETILWKYDQVLEQAAQRGDGVIVPRAVQ